MSQLTKQQIKRYNRQIIVPSIGVKGQVKLLDAKVVIVGAGGLGCPVSSNLTGTGVGTIGIVDYDEVEESNLHRQLLHYESDVLKNSKVDSAINKLQQMNSSIKFIRHNILINSSNAFDILRDYDIVVDCTDNVATRYLLNDACVLLKKPLVSGSALQLEGQLTVYNYQDGPCYRCIFSKPPPPETVQNCGDSGVIGAVTGVIGSLQAMEVVKIIMNHENVMSGKLLLYDAAMCSFRNIKLRSRRKDCEVCGDNPTITKLINYEQFCGMCAMDKNPNLKILSENERMSVSDYQNITNDHLLIDVRAVNEFEMCQIKNSINVPIKQLLAGKLNDELLNEMRQKDVYVVCRRGNDSQLAVKCLSDKYSIKSKDLIGGLYKWNEEIDNNFPLY
ncbi:unnamed protein product [Chironomus riparius]|uniref:Adenylyltransferase and sulfurtransferase MOCS3 homolog n=1 Tax=Chironomus riparius TaxID=315576 RepID=A0A9N9S3D4_9DIPT|nr:unnamed protein product [Chironomus riparius]